MKRKQIILTLGVGIIALGTIGVGASVAWYINSNNLYVNAIDITISSGPELLISRSTDLDSFVSELDLSSEPKKSDFAPVTGAYSSSWINNKADKPVFYDDTSNFIFAENGSRKITSELGYYQETLYLYSDTTADVIIDPSNTYLKANASFNNAYAQEIKETANQENVSSDYLKYRDMTVEQIAERLNKLPEAMRFSVLVPDEEVYQYGIIDPNKDQTKIVEYGGLLDVNIDGYFDSFHDGNVNKEHFYGDINDPNKIVYAESELNDSDYVDPTKDTSAFNARHEANVQRFDKEASLNNGLVINKEPSLGLYDFSPMKENKPFVIRCNEYEPRKIVLTIYIEGWDLESVNYTMGASFIASLGFRVDRPSN